MSDYDNNIESKWNFDGAQYEFIFMIKREVSLSLHNWNLDEAYTSLRTFRREVDALADEISYKEKKNRLEFDDAYVKKRALKAIEETERIKRKEKGIEEEEEKIETSEKKELAKYMERVEEMRTIYEENKDDEKVRSDFYLLIEETYLFICRILKQHKAFFREESKYMGL